MLVLYLEACNSTRPYRPLVQPHGGVLLQALALNVSLDKNDICWVL